MSYNQIRNPNSQALYRKEYLSALEYAARTGRASCDLFQRELSMLYQKSRFFVKEFTEKGYLSQGGERDLRKTLITYEEYENIAKNWG